jgi:hypothetical protein
MIKKILYLVMILVGGLIVYFVSLSHYALTMESSLLKSSFENAEYSAFLKFTTLYFEEEPSYITNTQEDVTVVVHKIIGYDQGEFIQGYAVFVSNIDASAHIIASKPNDPLDQSNMIVTSNSGMYNYLDRLPAGTSMALSYGLVAYGGYYIQYQANESSILLFELFDYEGEKLIEFNVLHVGFDEESQNWEEEEWIDYFDNNSSLTARFSNEEKRNMFIDQINLSVFLYAFAAMALTVAVFWKDMKNFKK